MLLKWGSKFVGFFQCPMFWPMFWTNFGMVDWFLNFVKMINILEDFLSERKPRVVLNSQCWYSCWCTTRIHFGTFVIFNILQYLSNYIKGKCKLLADDKSLFSVFITFILQQMILIMI